jgi:ATP-binding cassette subfamily C protein
MTIKLLFDYIKELYQYSKIKFIENFLFMVLDGFTSGISLFMLIPLLSLIGLTGETSVSIPIVDKAMGVLKGYDLSIQLGIVLLIYLVLIILQALISRKLSLLNTEIIQGYTKYLRGNLYKNLVQAEWRCLIGKKKSDITNAFTNEISRIASGTLFLLRLTSQIIIACFQLGVAFLLSVPLTIFVIFCGILLLLIMNTTFKESKRLGGSLRLINQELLSQIMEQLNGVKEVKSYGIEHTQIKSFEKITEKTEKNINDFTRLQAKSKVLYKIAAAFVISLIFYFSIVFLKIEATALLIIIYIFARLWPMFSSFQNNVQNVLAMIPFYESLRKTMFDLQQHSEKIVRKSDKSQDKMVETEIRFHHVSFFYNQEEEFELKDLNFSIPVKSMTAIVGRSGGGKSTIIDLLLGLLKPTKGHIMADHKAVDSVSLYQWRQCIGYVPQEPFLFNASIRDNLLRFSPDASMDEMDAALQRSDAYGFVMNLSNGINTIIGDNGVRLSGGQRQRIVLARALLRKPEILILDEATSALDNESEFKIKKAVDALSEELTVIVVAHRLSTIQNANKIIVIDHGKIVEEGTCFELLHKKNGRFKESHDLDMT